jgi:hypothetical protein
MVEKRQKYYIVNPKSLPYSSITFSKDGKTLLAGESMVKHANVHHFEYSTEEGCYVKKVLIKTLFHNIDRIVLSFDSSLFVLNGSVFDSNKKDVQMYEIFDLTKKKGIKQHRLSKKPKGM